jgi:HSP20 family molecular chaperone IbpA
VTEVVTGQVKVVFKHGVLEVRLPKAERAKAATPKRIKIE